MKPHEKESLRHANLLAKIEGSNLELSASTLLFITFNEPDGEWLEKVLLHCLKENFDPQIRALAVTCMGHTGRIRGQINRDLVAKLKELAGDPKLGPRAEEALNDIKSVIRDVN